ncbi:Wadjet anti-phage system protein JetA family protein [Alteromonas sp. a30]|uniref:Wadjet anti-phage system protein JetA family protein n=1 Tax=Alteromonas sp. a30 TaxID=2730917 RepID=UPI002282A996|nr:Wadjet anti-phage system protein JetA family protein [Alteromonas sp. a30]MCY7296233.1 hypothetical protein [Alteromonas sp. a30]
MHKEESKTVGLFDRIPIHLFRPLSAHEHAVRNWELINHLYAEFFAPEADPPELDGWAFRQVTSSIERFLQNWDDKHGIAPDETHTPLNVRANEVLKALLDSEWLSRERAGFDHYIIMRPTVQSLFELLKNFAEQGPEFVGGRVQSIKNNLKQVHADPEKNASVFQLVAKECSNLLQMLNTTRMRVREANEKMREIDTTELFVTEFFGQYISSLYIGDYLDLFSQNHPLTARWEIINLASELIDNEKTKVVLLAWYRKNLRCKNDIEANERLTADVERVEALRSVDRLLKRLKDTVTRANNQAINYMEYKVRSTGNFEQKIDDAIDAIIRTADSLGHDDFLLPIGLNQGRLLSEQVLRPPKQKPKKRKGAIIQRRQLSPEAQARRLIRQIMKGNRDVSQSKIVEYIDRHLPQGGHTTTADMSIDSINDLCVMAAFSRLGMLAERQQYSSSKHNANLGVLKNLFKHVLIELTGERFENDFIEAPVVKITRLTQKENSYVE